VFRFYTMQAETTKHGRIAAWLVHLYTASGAVLAFAGMRAVVRHDARLAFLMMLAATIVDATDGVLARAARVKEITPEVDGSHIDDLVDYLTFVFLPMFLLDEFGLLPPTVGLAVVAVVLLSSLYGFTAADAKTADHFFTGFPSYWNVVALYVFVFSPPPAWTAAVLVVLSGLIFVRIGYVYPSRTPVLRGLTVTLSCFWGAAVAILVVTLPAPSRTLAIASLSFPVYYTVLSLVLHLRRRPVVSI
jgi:phosphatidylcholine synthase